MGSLVPVLGMDSKLLIESKPLNRVSGGFSQKKAPPEGTSMEPTREFPRMRLLGGTRHNNSTGMKMASRRRGQMLQPKQPMFDEHETSCGPCLDTLAP